MKILPEFVKIGKIKEGGGDVEPSEHPLATALSVFIYYSTIFKVGNSL